MTAQQSDKEQKISPSIFSGFEEVLGRIDIAISSLDYTLGKVTIPFDIIKNQKELALEAGKVSDILKGYNDPSVTNTYFDKLDSYKTVFVKKAGLYLTKLLEKYNQITTKYNELLLENNGNIEKINLSIMAKLQYEWISEFFVEKTDKFETSRRLVSVKNNIQQLLKVTNVNTSLITSQIFQLVESSNEPLSIDFLYSTCKSFRDIKSTASSASPLQKGKSSSPVISTPNLPDKKKSTSDALLKKGYLNQTEQIERTGKGETKLLSKENKYTPSSALKRPESPFHPLPITHTSNESLPKSGQDNLPKSTDEKRKNIEMTKRDSDLELKKLDPTKKIKKTTLNIIDDFLGIARKGLENLKSLETGAAAQPESGSIQNKTTDVWIKSIKKYLKNCQTQISYLKGKDTDRKSEYLKNVQNIALELQEIESRINKKSSASSSMTESHRAHTLNNSSAQTKINHPTQDQKCKPKLSARKLKQKKKKKIQKNKANPKKNIDFDFQEVEKEEIKEQENIQNEKELENNGSHAPMSPSLPYPDKEESNHSEADAEPQKDAPPQISSLESEPPCHVVESQQFVQQRKQDKQDSFEIVTSTALHSEAPMEPGTEPSFITALGDTDTPPETKKNDRKDSLMHQISPSIFSGLEGILGRVDAAMRVLDYTLVKVIPFDCIKSRKESMSEGAKVWDILESYGNPSLTNPYFDKIHSHDKAYFKKLELYLEKLKEKVKYMTTKYNELLEINDNLININLSIMAKLQHEWILDFFTVPTDKAEICSHLEKIENNITIFLQNTNVDTSLIKSQIFQLVESSKTPLSIDYLYSTCKSLGEIKSTASSAPQQGKYFTALTNLPNEKKSENPTLRDSKKPILPPTPEKHKKLHPEKKHSTVKAQESSAKHIEKDHEIPEKSTITPDLVTDKKLTPLERSYSKKHTNIFNSMDTALAKAKEKLEILRNAVNPLAKERIDLTEKSVINSIKRANESIKSIETNLIAAKTQISLLETIAHDQLRKEEFIKNFEVVTNELATLKDTIKTTEPRLEAGKSKQNSQNPPKSFPSEPEISQPTKSFDDAKEVKHLKKPPQKLKQRKGKKNTTKDAFKKRSKVEGNKGSKSSQSVPPKNNSTSQAQESSSNIPTSPQQPTTTQPYAETSKETSENLLADTTPMDTDVVAKESLALSKSTILVEPPQTIFLKEEIEYPLAEADPSEYSAEALSNEDNNSLYDSQDPSEQEKFLLKNIESLLDEVEQPTEQKKHSTQLLAPTTLETTQEEKLYYQDPAIEPQGYKDQEESHEEERYFDDAKNPVIAQKNVNGESSAPVSLPLVHYFHDNLSPELPTEDKTKHFKNILLQLGIIKPDSFEIVTSSTLHTEAPTKSDAAPSSLTTLGDHYTPPETGKKDFKNDSMHLGRLGSIPEKTDLKQIAPVKFYDGEKADDLKQKLPPKFTEFPEEFSLKDLEGRLTPEKLLALTKAAELIEELKKAGVNAYVHGSFVAECLYSLLTDATFVAEDIDLVIELPKGMSLPKLLEKVPLIERRFESRDTWPGDTFRNYVSIDTKYTKIEICVKYSNNVDNYNLFPLTACKMFLSTNPEVRVKCTVDLSTLGTLKQSISPEKIKEDVKNKKFPALLPSPEDTTNIRHYFPRFLKYLIRFYGSLQMSYYPYIKGTIQELPANQELPADKLIDYLENYFKRIFIKDDSSPEVKGHYSSMVKIIHAGNCKHPGAKTIFQPVCVALLSTKTPGLWRIYPAEHARQCLVNSGINMAAILQNYFANHRGDAMNFSRITKLFTNVEIIADLAVTESDTEIAKWEQWLVKKQHSVYSTPFWPPADRTHSKLSSGEDRSLSSNQGSLTTAQGVNYEPYNG